jgi:hypothetical protein
MFFIRTIRELRERIDLLEHEIRAVKQITNPRLPEDPPTIIYGACGKVHDGDYYDKLKLKFREHHVVFDE